MTKKIICLLAIVFLLSGCARKEGDYLSSGVKSEDGYFIIEKKVDSCHYIVSDPKGHKYYASCSKDYYYIVGGEYHDD